MDKKDQIIKIQKNLIKELKAELKELREYVRRTNGKIKRNG